MSLQIIKSIEGKAEYVLLPINAYRALKDEIDRVVAQKNEFEDFNLDDYVNNPVALARIKANLTQEELAERMGVSQAYISKLEAQDKVSAKVLSRAMEAVRARPKS
jgi:ribosome-binding protein aMBF1 (putative translation factor)